MEKTIVLCGNCQKHNAIYKWVGDGNVMDYIHGNYVVWCKCCCLKAQLKDAREKAKQVIPLARKLIKLKCK